jgi:hypothetical protein
VWGVKPGSRYAKSRFAGETRVSAPGLKASDSLRNDWLHAGAESSKSSRSWLRLGESAGCAERVKGVLEVPQVWWRKAMLAMADESAATADGINWCGDPGRPSSLYRCNGSG